MRPLSPEQFRELSDIVPPHELITIPAGYDYTAIRELISAGMLEIAIIDGTPVAVATLSGELAYRIHLAWLASGGEQ